MDPGSEGSARTRTVDEAVLAELRRVVADVAPDALVVTAADGRIVLGNRRARELFGYDDRTLVGLGIDDLLPESVRAAHARHRARYAEHPRARNMGSGLELLGLRSDGSELPVEVSLTPVTVAGDHYVVAAIRDLAERRAAAASLSAARDRLALIAERERIGRDLHDSVIQRLYGAGLAMQAALESDGDRLRRVVSGAVDEIDDTIAEIRTVIHDLRRDVIDADRLTERLQMVVDGQSAALGVPVELQITGDAPREPSPQLADAALAVVREAIANAHRHGRAARIDVALEFTPDRVVLEVRDDGVGFDPSRDADGYGLKNLRARALEFGGTFTVDAAPGSGTRLLWTVPSDAGRPDGS